MATTAYPRSPHGAFAKYFIAMPEFGVPYISGVEYNTLRPNFTHSHPETQMLSILRGKMFVCIPPRTFELNPGGVCIIPAECKHKVSQDPRVPHVLFVDIRMNGDGVFGKFLETFGGQQEFKTDATTLRACAAELRRLQTQFGPLRTSRLMSVLWRIFGNLSQAPQSREEREEDGDDRRLELADGYMKDALATPLNVERVAEYVELSRSQLTRLYMQHKKIGPAERLRQLRVEKAMHLLTSSALNVKEIAYACGFLCPNHFCRIFRRQTKQTPSEYRTQHL